MWRLQGAKNRLNLHLGRVPLVFRGQGTDLNGLLHSTATTKFYTFLPILQH